MVGHNCDKPKKQGQNKTKQAKRWVPKAAPKVSGNARVPVTEQAAGRTAFRHHLLRRLQLSLSQPPVTSDDDGGWRVVSRKYRDKGKRTMRGSGSMTNAFQVLLGEQPAVVGSDPGDGAESVYLS